MGITDKEGKIVRTRVLIMISFFSFLFSFFCIADRIISGQTENSVWLTLSAITGLTAVRFATIPWSP